MINIDCIELFEYAVNKGLNPLLDWQRFSMPFELRVKLQKELFGKTEIIKGNIPVANQKFYKYCWDNHWLLNGQPVHRCEECQKPLYQYSATFISHIISRSSAPDMAHDCRNFNLLCFDHHRQWESPKNKKMKIYPVNRIIIKQLKHDYECR